MGKKIIFSEEQIKDIIKMYENNSITSIAKKYITWFEKQVPTAIAQYIFKKDL